MKKTPQKVSTDHLPLKQLGKKFLPGTEVFDAKYPILIALLLAVIATFAFVHAAAITSEDTVTLSNGQTVQLGETKAALAATLQANLHVVSENLYQYPADPKKPVEVLIYAQFQKVVAIEIINGRNIHALSGLRVGVTQQQVQAQLARRLRLLDQRLVDARFRGYAIYQTNSEAYFLTSPCEPNEKIIDVTLVQKSYAPILQSKTLPVDCANPRS